MGKESAFALLLVLLVWHRGSSEWEAFCPYKCQCFTQVQVLCSDERMSSLPRNLSKQVKEVIIMTSPVSYLFANTLQESPQVTKLILVNNNLRSIHSMAFESLTELQELEISGNVFLEHLFLGTFSKQENLTKLLLNFNRFKTVLPGMFDSLKQLEMLQIRNNVISELPAFQFLNLSRLRSLDLSQNKLKEVTKETFFGLASLEILKINNNLLGNLTSDMFHNIFHLTELHLEGNKIEQLNDNIFSVLTNLIVLNLRGNLLTTFSDKVFGFVTSNLKELNLKNNKLTELFSLSSLPSVTDFILSSNQFSTLPESIFRNATALESLDLSENQLTSLPKSIFNNLSSITVLNLHKNNLTKVDAKLFEDQVFIQRLYLSENQLETLPVGILDPFVIQHTVRLHGNPWKCDCHMWYLYYWVMQHSPDIEMLDRMLCESPDFLRKRTITSIDRDQLVCHLSKDRMPDLSACSLQASNDTLIVKCKIKKCSPMMVKVQLEEDDGSIVEHILKNKSEESQCSNETMIQSTIH